MRKGVAVMQPQEAATVPKDMRKKLYGLLGKPRNAKAAAE